MKKFMKAIAFVTVMCLALSTVAFAANSAEKSTTDDKTVIVTVTEAGASDQVALMVVEAKATPDYDFSNPLYIDQKGMNSGSAEFEAKIAAGVEAVDVYVGYAANTDTKAVWVGKVALVQPITEVTISKVPTNLETDVVTEEGQQQVGVGAILQLSEVKAPAGASATNMIWAIRFMKDGVEKVKYTDPYSITGLGIGTNAVSGPIKLGLAFLNGFNRAGEEIASVEITGIDAIFLFKGTVDGKDFRQEVFTNDADKKPEN